MQLFSESNRFGQMLESKKTVGEKFNNFFCNTNSIPKYLI